MDQQVIVEHADEPEASLPPVRRHPTTSGSPVSWEGDRGRPHRRGMWRWMLLAVVVVLIIAVEVGGVRVSGRPWSAVFLANGQVYFGHIVRSRSDTVVLREVYYLQVAPNLQQPASGPTDLTLVKLGKELHGPMDEMRINRQHVLFTETLQQESPVVRAIERVRRGETVAAPPPSTPSPAAAPAAPDEGAIPDASARGKESPPKR